MIAHKTNACSIHDAIKATDQSWEELNLQNFLSLSSDLVNGLVLLMNSNISSPVNLVSASFSALTILTEYAAKIGTF